MASREERPWNQYWTDLNSKDLSRNGLHTFPEDRLPITERDQILSLQIHHNSIGILPGAIGTFSNLVILDASNNGLCHIAEEIGRLSFLQTLVVKNNNLDNDSLPKNFDQLHSLQAVNLSGNRFTEFPSPLIHMPQIQKLYLASNRIEEMPNLIHHIQRLVFL